MEVTRICGHSGVGGIFVNSDLTAAFTCRGTITFDWDRMKKADFTRVCSSIEQGFTVSHGGAVRAVLNMLGNIDGIPKVPDIGYMGKKAMSVLVPKAKLKQYQTDLIAAGHMLDVDLSEAVKSQTCTDWEHKYVWLTVDGWEVKHHNPKEEVRDRRGRRRGGDHLKPATSKLANLVRTWQEELLPERKPLLEFVKRKPTLTFNLETGLDV